MSWPRSQTKHVGASGLGLAQSGCGTKASCMQVLFFGRLQVEQLEMQLVQSRPVYSEWKSCKLLDMWNQVHSTWEL